MPEILKQVLVGLDVTYEIQGTFEPRNYCVQYRESDFNFASRLMEEEGIFYYLEHTADSHRMIVANTPVSHRECPTKPDPITTGRLSRSGRMVRLRKILAGRK